MHGDLAPAQKTKPMSSKTIHLTSTPKQQYNYKRLQNKQEKMPQQMLRQSLSLLLICLKSTFKAKGC